jgi:hypothetical protein
MLATRHAKITNLPQRFCDSHRLHYHGDVEKARLNPAQCRRAESVAIFNKVVFSWRPVKAGRQFSFFGEGIFYHETKPGDEIHEKG